MIHNKWVIFIFSYVEICSNWVWYAESNCVDNVESECFELISDLDSAVRGRVLDHVVRLVLAGNELLNPFSICCHFPVIFRHVIEIDPDFPRRIKLDHVTQRILTNQELHIFDQYKFDQYCPREIILQMSRRAQCVQKRQLRMERSREVIPRCLENSINRKSCEQTAHAAAHLLKIINLKKMNSIDLSDLELDFSFSLNLLRSLQLSLTKFEAKSDFEFDLIFKMNKLALGSLTKLSEELPPRISKETSDQLAKLLTVLWEISCWFNNNAATHSNPDKLISHGDLGESGLRVFIQKFIQKRLFKESCIYYFTELMRRKFNIIWPQMTSNNLDEVIYIFLSFMNDSS